MAPKINMTPKTKKIINIVVDVVVAIVLAFALFLAVCTISSKAKGYDQYTEVFGKAYLAVRTDSMEGDGEDNFTVGDMIVIKTVSLEETRAFEVGDIITFKTAEVVEGKTVLNTHRIISVEGDVGYASAYITHGDNAPEGVNEHVLVSSVVGVYQGKSSGIGKLFLFMGSSAGFFTCIVLPTLLIVVYFAINLILVIRKEKKAQAEAAILEHADERERIRQELLAEMQANGAASTPPVEKADTDNGNKPTGGDKQ